MACSSSIERIAKQAVTHARLYKCPDLGCYECGEILQNPATHYCGHTRCIRCVNNKTHCPCGHPYPITNSVVTISIRNILDQMFRREQSMPKTSLGNRGSFAALTGTADNRADSLSPMQMVSYRRLNARTFEIATVKGRLKHAMSLIQLGMYKEAAPHLALAVVAAENSVSLAGDKAMAETMLRKAISKLLPNSNELKVTGEIYRSVRTKNREMMGNIETSELECPICLDILYDPVTTPCGHTFCRPCISRTLYHRKHCALCSRPLDLITIIVTDNTLFIMAALKLKKLQRRIPPGNEIRFIPIFCCTVAFPTIPCPILILGAYHRKIIQKILDSGIKRIGMVTSYSDGTVASAGTIVEVRDCLQLEDGRTILSTVGLSRFRTLKRTHKDESHIAQVVDLKDTLTDEEYVSMHLEDLAQSITEKALKWLSSLSETVLTDIHDAFGPMPCYKDEYRWWTNPDSPRWLWWIIAILPLNAELQVLILSTVNLEKRMLAVSRTLDVIVLHYDTSRLCLSLQWRQYCNGPGSCL